MSLLKKVFKKKPGGTFVGNLIRGAVKKTTGIDIPKPAAPAAPAATGITPDQLGEVLGNVLNKQYADKPGSLINKIASTEAGGNLLDSATNAAMQSAQNSVKMQLKAWFKKNWMLVVFPILGLVSILFYMFKKPKRKSYGRR